MNLIMTHKYLGQKGYKYRDFPDISLTWLENIADHAERFLRVEQAICTSGVCNTLLFPDMGKPNSEISGSRDV